MMLDGPVLRSYLRDLHIRSSHLRIPEPSQTPLGTTPMDFTDRDANGRRFSEWTQIELRRLRAWDRRSQANGGNHYAAIREIRRLAEKMALNGLTVERACSIYRQALKKGFTRGRALPALVPAILYASCRETGTPRTLKDFAQATSLKKKEIARFFRQLYNVVKIDMPTADPSKFVSRVATNLSLSEKVKRRALALIELAKEKGSITGKYPMGIVAAALYISATMEGENVNQKDLARCAGVTEVTIRNRTKGLKDLLESKDG